MSKDIIICWDFDETLGYFRPMEFSYLQQPIPPEMPKPFLKPGIAEGLKSLAHFTNIVTTAAIGEYARFALKEFGLLGYFSDVIGREDGIYTASGKDYSIVAERFGFDENDVAQRLIIVGNDSRVDPDCYFRGVVMIYDKDMVEYPAEIIVETTQALVDKGENNPSVGFKRFIAEAQQGTPWEHGVVSLDKIRFSIDYFGNFIRETVHPMIISPRFVDSVE